jgi:hypothetical protein
MSHLPTLGGASGPPTPFPSAALAHLRVAGRRPRPIARGSISEHCAIVFNGPNLEVLCPNSGNRLTAWSFASDDDPKSASKSSRDDSDSFGTSLTTEITCVSKLALSSPRRGVASHTRLYVVVGTSTGLVAIVDVKSSQLVRVVRFQHRVNSVAVVSNGSRASTDEDVVTSRIFQDGLIAVGTQEGHLYLVVSFFAVLNVLFVLLFCYQVVSSTSLFRQPFKVS